jgi:cytoskeletal protein CcmA (bactofilin family)
MMRGSSTDRSEKSIHISGSDAISRVDCSQFSVSGAVTVEQSLQAENAIITGTSVVEGDAEVRQLDISGNYGLWPYYFGYYNGYRFVGGVEEPRKRKTCH